MKRVRTVLEKFRGREGTERSSHPPAQKDTRLESSQISLVDRVQERLRSGATIDAIARLEEISLPLAQIMVEELTRSGRVVGAESLCASGLGLCGGATDQAARLYCAGCPLVPLKPATKDQSGVTQ